MVDWSDIKTANDMIAILNAFTNITTAEVRLYNEGQWWKPADNYLIDHIGITPEYRGGYVGYYKMYNSFLIYIKGSSEANRLLKASYISDGFIALRDGNNLYQVGGLELLPKKGKLYIGYIQITQELYNVKNGYT